MDRRQPGRLLFASTAEFPAQAPAAASARAEGLGRSRPALAGWLQGGRFYVSLAGVALVIAALSLLIPSTPSYDPWAWLIWGREIIHLDLHTPGGPSWKPLPVLFTTVFALFGGAQPDLWLVVARAGAIVGVVTMFKLAWRLTRALSGEAPPELRHRAVRLLWLAGPLLAGVIAAGSVINSSGFLSNNALGYSEGLATALMLVSVDRFLDGAHRQAFVVGFFAALNRPELWLFWGAYGVWLFWREPQARRLVIGLFVMIPVLWFLPELWGSGHLLRGVTRAQHPRSNSAAFTSCPVCTVFKKEAWHALLNRVKVPAIIALVVAAVGLWRTRRAWWRTASFDAVTRGRAGLLTVGLFGYVWWLGIALETQAGFSGNNRYLVLGTAPVAIAGGVAWGWFASWLGRLLARVGGRAPGALRTLTKPPVALAGGLAGATALFLVIPPWIGTNIVSLPRTHRALVYQAHLRADAAAAVRQAGGSAAVLRCGTIMTEGFQVPMVAWTLGVGTSRVQAPPGNAAPAGGALPAASTLGPAPNVILQTRETRNATLLPLPQDILAWEHAGTHYTLVAHNRTFRVFTTCG